MRIAKTILAIAVAVSGMVTGVGLFGFFAVSQPKMHVLAVTTVSAFIAFLLAGIVWSSIDISEHIAEMVGFGRDAGIQWEQSKIIQITKSSL
jgi:hypothetical protein